MTKPHPKMGEKTGEARLTPRQPQLRARPSSYRQRLPRRPAPTSLVETRTQPLQRSPGYRQLLRADLYRKTGRSGLKTFLKTLATDMGFKHVFWFRTASFCRARPRLRRTLYPFVRAVYGHYQHKHGVWIPPTTKVGPGLFLEHLGNIVVNGRAVIGKNCNLGHGVTIGQSNRGARQGTPQIGDNVFIGPGAKIIGGIKLGDNVAVGVNCVVVRDVPDDAVIVAGAGQVVSYGGSSGYVNRTDYEAAVSTEQ